MSVKCYSGQKISLKIGVKCYNARTFQKNLRRTNEHLVTYLNLCLQVVFLTCEIYIGLYNLCNFNFAISIILIVELMIDVVIGLKLFHNQSI